MTDDALKALSTELYEAAGSTKPVSQDALVKADLIVRKFLLSRRPARSRAATLVRVCSTGYVKQPKQRPKG